TDSFATSAGVFARANRPRATGSVVSSRVRMLMMQATRISKTDVCPSAASSNSAAFGYGATASRSSGIASSMSKGRLPLGFFASAIAFHPGKHRIAAEGATLGPASPPMVNPPMNEEQWLSCTDPKAMLAVLPWRGYQRKLRLVGCGLYRQYTQIL